MRAGSPAQERLNLIGGLAIDDRRVHARRYAATWLAVRFHGRDAAVSGVVGCRVECGDDVAG